MIVLNSSTNSYQCTDGFFRAHFPSESEERLDTRTEHVLSGDKDHATAARPSEGALIRKIGSRDRTGDIPAARPLRTRSFRRNFLSERLCIPHLSA